MSPKGMEAKAASAKNTDTKGASTKSSRSARAGMKSSLVSILMASATGWSRPRMRMPKMDARLAPMRSCMMADCLRSTQVRIPPKLSTTNMMKATGMALTIRSPGSPCIRSAGFTPSPSGRCPPACGRASRRRPAPRRRGRAKTWSARSAVSAASAPALPRRAATSPKISQSGRASPRGAMAGRKRCTRPSKLVKVPSRSA